MARIMAIADAAELRAAEGHTGQETDDPGWDPLTFNELYWIWMTYIDLLMNTGYYLANISTQSCFLQIIKKKRLLIT